MYGDNLFLLKSFSGDFDDISGRRTFERFGRLCFIARTGLQRYFVSQDNALLISHTLATQKAWTAVALRMPTHRLAADVLPGASLYGLSHTQGLCCFGGGLPCWSAGVLLGGIGISGGSVEEDIAIATQTLARFSRERFLLTPFNESL